MRIMNTIQQLYKIRFLIIFSTFFITGCESWTDIDTDPDNITAGPAITEDIMLIGIEAEWVETANEKFETWYGYPTWLSWFAIEGSNAIVNVDPGFGNEVWNSYSYSLKHAVELHDFAEQNGNTYYQGIAGVIAAHHWFYIADVYDQAPLEQAMTGLENQQPELATQEELYAHANALLDEAINLFKNTDGGELLPGQDDYMLNGDIDRWVRFAYSLKARQAMRRIYAPGVDQDAQISAILSYLEKGMTSNEDNVMWRHLEDLANANPLYNYMTRAYSGGRGLTPGNFLIDMMNAYEDPRRPIMFTNAEADPNGYMGHFAGAAVQAGNRPSHYRFDYLSMSYPDHIMLYSESKFLEAEAYAFRNEWELAEIAMKEGNRADMEYMEVPQEQIISYNAQPSLDMPTNLEDAQQLIIQQKYLSNIFRTGETYFDYVRTGYPEFDFEYMIQNTNASTTFARRFPYPLNEIERNPNLSAVGQPDWFNKGTTWDNKN